MSGMPPSFDLDAAYKEMEATLATAVNEWHLKRANYGDAFLELGAKGQFSEIWRKIKKLQVGVWENKPLTGETPEQIAKEIIPHCLMMIYLLRREQDE